MYTEDVNYDAVRLAKKVLPYKVITNGDIKTAEQAIRVIEYTKADGVMIGRAAVANPWIFRQIRELKNGKTTFVQSSEDYLEYLQMLISEFGPNADINPKSLGGIKKYVVQLADSIGENDKIFLNTVRRASTIADIEDAFKKFLFI
jgi:tRNA-dihydrouridine synthase